MQSKVLKLCVSKCQTYLLIKVGTGTHSLIDTLAEEPKHEDGGDGGREVAGDGLDVVEELAALGRLHHGDPGDADGDQEQDEDPARERREEA